MASWWRRDRDAEIREEFDTHLALEIDRQMGDGLSPEQARDAAMKKFGNPIRHREDTRAAHGLVWWDHLSHDIRHALRSIARRKIAATAAMIALGVGIGGPAAVISLIVSQSMLLPPGVSNPGELVILWETPPQTPGSRRVPSLDTYETWRKHPDMFQSLSAAGVPLRLTFDQGDTRAQVRVQTMGIELLPLMGISPERGRAFAARDAAAGAPPVAIVSQGFWETRLGGRDDVIGSSISLHGRDTTIVGVMPRTFWIANRQVDLWVPLPERSRETMPAPLFAIARMTPGDHKTALNERLAALSAQVSAAQPERETGWGTRVDGLGAMEALNSDEMAPGFKILLIATVLGLLAACANIATVMVARGAARQLETAVRAALGAPRLRLIRQFLVESMLVALGGGGVAIVIVASVVRLLATSAPADIAVAINPTPSLTLLAGIVLAALAIGALAGLGPALADSRVNLIAALKSTGYFGSVRGNSRLRRALVVAEVTITVVLLAGVTILARGAYELASIGPGFDAARVIQMRIDPVEHVGRSAITPLDVDAVVERFAAVSGVESVSFTSGLLTGERRVRVIASATGDAAPSEVRRVHLNRVGHEYFQTLGLGLVDGRLFTSDDRGGAPVAIVSEVFARQSFPEGSAVGQSLRIGDDTTERTIVGVVSNVLLEGFRRQPSPIVYVPQPRGVPADGSGFIVRFTPGMRVLRDMERALEQLNPLLTMGYAVIAQDAIDAGAMEVRFTIFLVGPVILLALALTMSGIYGVLAQTVTHRTHEVALRMALGAERADVVRLIAWQGLELTMIGAVAGGAVALAADRLMGSLVTGVPGDRPAALISAALLIGAATLIASIAPCLRAMRIDPSTTLRYE